MPETSREYAAHELEAMGYVVRVLEQFCRVAADVEREGGGPGLEGRPSSLLDLDHAGAVKE